MKIEKWTLTLLFFWCMSLQLVSGQDGGKLIYVLPSSLQISPSWTIRTIRTDCGER